MKPVVWFVLMMTTFLALVAIFQIQLVQDLVTASGYSSAEVFSGIAGILIVFFFFLAIVDVRL